MKNSSNNINKTKQPALRLRKFIFHNHVHFVTCSVEEGIMLPANPLVKSIIKSAILRAQRLHPVVISHLLVNGTHIHMIIRIDNPQDLPDFMERLKTESAHYLNRLLGRKKRTIWCSGYDSPRLKGIKDVISKIAYTYVNPVQDGLIESVDNYPGLSSWHLFMGRAKRMFGILIGRDDLFKVDQDQDYRAFKKLSKLLARRGKLKELMIDTNDWFKSFGITEQDEIDQINQKIRKKVQEEQEKKQAQYAEQNKSFMGRKRLENQGIDKYHERKEQRGKKMWVICEDKEDRKLYIAFLKDLAWEARKVYEAWCKGDTSRRMPTGVFAPRMPVVANLIGV